jgi:hypothetical protein
VKLAVRKEEGTIPGSGYHYFLYPIEMENDAQAEVFRMMGHIVIEVADDVGARLIREAAAALFHQVEVAWLAEKK